MSTPETQAWYSWMDSQPSSVILDGGLGELVQKRGSDILAGSLWSGQLIKSNPDELKNVADEWLNVGAEIISTATYQVTIDVLAKEFNLTKQETEQCVQGHCEQLESAAADYWNKVIAESKSSSPPTKITSRKPIVALSIGPLSAIHPDYDEFSSHYKDDITEDYLFNYHSNRVESFLGISPSSAQTQNKKKPPASIVAFETMGVISEAKAICKVMNNYELPFWLSFQCRDLNSLASGHSLVEAIHTVLDTSKSHKRLVALGVNCVCISMVNTLIAKVKAEVDKYMQSCDAPWRVNIIAYPNSGEVWHDRSWGWSHGEEGKINGPLLEDDWAQIVMKSNANIIGGCCRTDPTHIAALRRAALAAH